MLILMMMLFVVLFLIIVIAWLRTLKSDPNEYLEDDYYVYPEFKKWDPLKII